MDGEKIVNKSREIVSTLKGYSISDCKKILHLITLIIDKGSEVTNPNADISPHDTLMKQYY